MIRHYELVEKIKRFNPDADEESLNRAYVLAMQAHGSQRRANGDPFFHHPLEVANILADLRQDIEVIIAGLLHDIVEDTAVSLDDVNQQFGIGVKRLVDGVTRLPRLMLRDARARRREDFLKFITAISQDPRVLLVKLADRLHNMRTLHHLSEHERRQNIAEETLAMYAPLAERVGLESIKEELQNLAFAELHPEAHTKIERELEGRYRAGGDLIRLVKSELAGWLQEDGIGEVSIEGRVKSPYSIWQKLLRINRPNAGMLADVMAFRIIVGDDLRLCYRTLGIVHSHYISIPGHLKDYISNPKANGYQSIHTVVVACNQPIEVQIRTQAMHDRAESGAAAHWSYKQQPKDPKLKCSDKTQWLRELVEAGQQAGHDEEFLKQTVQDLGRDQVFCFTPKGDLIVLPQGATPVDFAYAIHSQVGDQCIGAKVNDRAVPLDTNLRDCDQVRILTSKRAQPSKSWEQFVVTSKARACVRRHWRERQQHAFIQLGRTLLQREFHSAGRALSDAKIEEALTELGQRSTEEVYANTGAGNCSSKAVLQAVLASSSRAEEHSSNGTLQRDAFPPMVIDGLVPNLAIHYAHCCRPVPGDRIVGILTAGKGVTIHAIACSTLESFHHDPERWVDVSWNAQASQHSEGYSGRIMLVAVSEQDGSSNRLIEHLTPVVGKNGGKLVGLKVQRKDPIFVTMQLDLEVRDRRQLSNIVAGLRMCHEVVAAERASGF